MNSIASLGHLPLPSCPAAPSTARFCGLPLPALGLVLLALGASLGLAQPAPAPRPAFTAEEKAQGYSNHSLLAKPRPAAAEAELATGETREGLRLRQRLGERGAVRVLEPAAGETILAAIDRLRATGRYEYVEPDYLMKIDATPDDTYFLTGDQWALRNSGQNGGTRGADIRAEEGWTIQSTAPNVVIAVLDSGRNAHSDLTQNFWSNPGEVGPTAVRGRDDDGNGYVDDVGGLNATVAGDNSLAGVFEDNVGHGTAVASVIAANTNNSAGMSGIVWQTRLMTLKFIGPDEYGLVSDEIRCIDYAIANRAHLINASFGGAAYSQSLFDALKRARDAGIIVVCSAGNDGDNSDEVPHYPSGYLLDNIVAVANTTRTDELAASSTYGSGLVELAAPGTSIVTAAHTDQRAYRFMSGTSFSAPMVTGALALLKARFPEDTYRDSINRLLRGVDPLPALAGKTATGGRLNLAGALRGTNPRPFNDEFSGRAQLAGETISARSAGQRSTRETGEPVHAGAAGNGSLWWTWTAPRSGPATIDTAGSAYDTLLAVYTGATLAALAPVASNDDESGALTTSKVAFTATAGTTYQIAVDAKTTTTGLAVLRVKLNAGNDAFASAQPVTGRSWQVRANNRVATRETGEPRIKNNAGTNSVWYRWVAPATRRYHLATYSSDFNTMIGVFTGNSLATLAEVASATTAGDTNFIMSSAGVSFTATAGTAYAIVVDSEVSSSGTSATGEFVLSCVDSDWEFFGNGDPGTPAVAADGTLHFADFYGYVYALNQDGSRKWRYEMTGYGTFSAPAVAADGTVYVGDDSHYVHAITPTGTRKWRTTTQGAVNGSPALGSDGTVYVRSDDGKLYALNPDNGTVRWSLQLGAAGFTYTSPAVAPDGTIYCAGADSKLYAVTPAGAQKWSFAGNLIYASPVIGSDGTIYIGTSSPMRRFFALKPDGTTKWELIVADSVTSSAVIGTDGTLYFGCYDKKLYAVSSAGVLRWTYESGDAIRGGSPLIASDGAIYTGSLDGKVHCVEPDGKLRRVYATANSVFSSPLLHNGRLFLPSYDFRMYSIDVGQVPASSAWPMHRQNPRRQGRSLAQPLSIAVQPRPVSAEVGETVSFSVGALGTAPLTYQWLFNGQVIAGATGVSYSVNPVTHATGGQYSARVTDASGTVTSSTAALTVTTPLLPPSIFTAPAPQTIVAGTTVTLAVGAQGTAPFTYQWLRDGEAIPGATGSTLVLATARLTDSGNYSVRITNQVGTITSPAASITINPITRISNLSIRSRVGGDVGPLTVGLTVGGQGATGAKPLLLRAVGPTLSVFGVTGFLADPLLAVLSGETVVAQNDNWAGNAQVATTNIAVGAFGFASDTSRDAALAHSADSGGYTVRITGVGGSAGVALAEVYDASPAETFFGTTPRLTNVSALTQVGTGGDVLIAGFAITGTVPQPILIRGIGPTLAAFGVAGALADPKLEIFAAGSTSALATNDNWNSALNAAQVATTSARVGAFALAPDSKDAVLLVTLPPGSYTAQISGINNTTGAALVEIYEVP